jgi:hypothetical protein
VVIEEINPSPEDSQQKTSHASVPSQLTKKNSSAPLIKKGFLNNSKTQPALYPEGSQEGSGGAKGGSYARLMSRCQVVDANTMQSTPPAAPTPSNPPPSSRPAGSKTKESPQPALSQAESRELDHLMCGVDEDWNQLSSRKKTVPQVCRHLTLSSCSSSILPSPFPAGRQRSHQTALPTGECESRCFYLSRLIHFTPLADHRRRSIACTGQTRPLPPNPSCSHSQGTFLFSSLPPLSHALGLSPPYG